MVHGFHVGADQAYANRGDVVDRDRSMTSRDVTIASGKSPIGILRPWHIENLPRSKIHYPNRHGTWHE